MLVLLLTSGIKYKYFSLYVRTCTVHLRTEMYLEVRVLKYCWSNFRSINPYMFWHIFCNLNAYFEVRTYLHTYNYLYSKFWIFLSICSEYFLKVCVFEILWVFLFFIYKILCFLNITTETELMGAPIQLDIQFISADFKNGLHLNGHKKNRFNSENSWFCVVCVYSRCIKRSSFIVRSLKIFHCSKKSLFFFTLSTLSVGKPLWWNYVHICRIFKKSKIVGLIKLTT